MTKKFRQLNPKQICNFCQGTGKRYAPAPDTKGWDDMIESVCDSCGGAGVRNIRVVDDETKPESDH